MQLTGGAGGIALACAAAPRRSRGPVLLADLDGGSGLRERRPPGARRATCTPRSATSRTRPSVAALAARAAELGPLGALVHTAGLAPPGAARSAARARRQPRWHRARARRVRRSSRCRAASPSASPRSPATARSPPSTTSCSDAPDLFDRLEHADVLRTYSISKRGVMLECRRRAAAWGAQGARIVSISPGLVLDTSIGQAAATIHAGAYAEQSALKRAGVAADIAGAVAFLTSDDASYITGCGPAGRRRRRRPHAAPRRCLRPRSVEPCRLLRSRTLFEPVGARAAAARATG